MMQAIRGVSPVEEIIERYAKLHWRVRSVLTDHYNLWLGLKLMAQGEDFQREIGLESMNNRMQRGEPPYRTGHIPRVRGYVTKALRRSPATRYSLTDLVHLDEVEALRLHACEKAKIGMPIRDAKLIYGYLIPLLYGRIDQTT